MTVESMPDRPLRVGGERATPLTSKELDLVARRHRAHHGDRDYLVIRPDCDFCLVLYTAGVLLGIQDP